MSRESSVVAHHLDFKHLINPRSVESVQVSPNQASPGVLALHGLRPKDRGWARDVIEERGHGFYTPESQIDTAFVLPGDSELEVIGQKDWAGLPDGMFRRRIGLHALTVRGPEGDGATFALGRSESASRFKPDPIALSARYFNAAEDRVHPDTSELDALGRLVSKPGMPLALGAALGAAGGFLIGMGVHVAGTDANNVPRVAHQVALNEYTACVEMEPADRVANRCYVPLLKPKPLEKIPKQSLSDADLAPGRVSSQEELQAAAAVESRALKDFDRHELIGGSAMGAVIFSIIYGFGRAIAKQAQQESGQNHE